MAVRTRDELAEIVDQMLQAVDTASQRGQANAAGDPLRGMARSWLTLEARLTELRAAYGLPAGHRPDAAIDHLLTRHARGGAS